jgi:multidrug resistance efflux pump
LTSSATTERVSDRLYRKEALERLMAPEKLDQLLSLARPKGWVTLLALALLLATAGLWVVWGSVTDTAMGQGAVVRIPTQGSSSLVLVLRLPQREAAVIRNGMAARVVPLTDGSTAVPWRGIIRSVSAKSSRRAALSPGASSSGGEEVQLRLRLDASPGHEAGILARGMRCSVTITTGKRSPLGAFIR